MVWLAFAGIVLQIAGLALAVRGVSLTYRQAVPGGRFWRDTALAFAQWVRIKVFRRTPDATVHAVAATALASFSGSAYGQVRPRLPAEDAMTEEQIAYLRRMVEILSNEITEARAFTREVVQEAETRIGTRLDDVSARVDRTATDVASMWNALWGRDGRGLRDAAVRARHHRCRHRIDGVRPALVNPTRRGS